MAWRMSFPFLWMPHNKARQLTAKPLRGLSAADLGR